MLKGPQFLHFPDINGFNILIIAEVSDSKIGFDYISVQQVISGTLPDDIVGTEDLSDELHKFFIQNSWEIQQLIHTALEIVPGLKMDRSKPICIPQSIEIH